MKTFVLNNHRGTKRTRINIKSPKNPLEKNVLTLCQPASSKFSTGAACPKRWISPLAFCAAAYFITSSPKNLLRPVSENSTDRWLGGRENTAVCPAHPKTPQNTKNYDPGWLSSSRKTTISTLVTPYLSNRSNKSVVVRQNSPTAVHQMSRQSLSTTRSRNAHGTNAVSQAAGVVRTRTLLQIVHQPVSLSCLPWKQSCLQCSQR